MTSRRRRHVLTTAAALAGLLLFGYAVRRAGVTETLEAIRRVGWGLLPILLLGGLRFMIRAEAWRLCAPQGSRLRFADALTAFLAGDAIGNVTPLGLIASEPTKVFLTRHHLDTRESVASLAIDNLVYTGSVLAMIAVGIVVLLLTVPLPFEWQEWGVGALAALLIVGLAGVLILRGSWSSGRGQRPRWRERLSAIRLSVLEFSAGHPARLWRVFALDLLFHAVAVFEAWLALGWLLGDRRPTLADAVIFESLNRVTTVVFKFVPFRVGVDEAVSGAFAPLLAVNPVAGVALAVVRKVRNLFWAAIGLALIAAHHGRGARVMGPPESAPVRRT